MRTVIRVLWAAPTTALGVMLLVAGAWRMRLRLVDGVVEAHGPALAWMLTHLAPISTGASALTLGHVVVGRDASSLEQTRAHERIHVRQCESWGPLFLPAYLGASLITALRGRHYYYDNPFEREAYRKTNHRPESGANRERVDRMASDKDNDLSASAPSTLDFDRSGSAARTGGARVDALQRELTHTDATMAAGDLDADSQSAYQVGDEAPGGDNPTPDQDVVDEIGAAVGLEYQDNEELGGEDKVADRDRHRWELDPASSEDYPERRRD